MTPKLDDPIHNTINEATRDGHLENRLTPAGDTSSYVWTTRTTATMPAQIASGGGGQSAGRIIAGALRLRCGVRSGDAHARNRLRQAPPATTAPAPRRRRR